MRSLLKLDLHSRRVCFLVETMKCCGEIVTDISRFCIEIKKDTILAEPVIVSYGFFDSDDDGRMCILLDDAMADLCPGRYVFEILLDDCIPIKTIKFLWGGKPVVTDVKVESNSQGDCYDETGNNEFEKSSLVKACCDKPETCDCDPCAKCNCKPCGCEREFEDPEELIKRDC